MFVEFIWQVLIFSINNEETSRKFGVKKIVPYPRINKINNIDNGNSMIPSIDLEVIRNNDLI